MKKDSYWREIILALAVKIFALTLIWYAWFSSPAGDHLDEAQVAAQILQSQSVKESDHGAVH